MSGKSRLKCKRPCQQILNEWGLRQHLRVIVNVFTAKVHLSSFGDCGVHNAGGTAAPGFALPLLDLQKKASYVQNRLGTLLFWLQDAQLWSWDTPKGTQ